MMRRIIPHQFRTTLPRRALLASQALEVLALRPGATSSEMKEAYRDLVKVWHPDRFGNDPRLREKAEHQLQLINEAYRALQSDQDMTGGHATTSGGGYQTAAPRRRHKGSGLGRRRVAWISGTLFFLVFLAALLASYPVQQDAKSQDDAPSAQIAPSAAAGSTDVRPKRSEHAKDPGLKRFSVRSLSDAESDRMQMTCAAQRRAGGEAAFEKCVQAQVAMLTRPTSAPDLSALNDAEHESIEKTCAEARLHGPERYNGCLIQQAASLAAEPARPDLSALSDADRQGVESACSNEKDRDGPAAYDRCVERFVEALTN